MRLALTLLSVTAISGSLFAQEAIEIWPGATSFTSRGNIGTGDGETLQGFHSSHWAGIGNLGAVCELVGLSSISQDQNPSTQETFDWVIRPGIDAFGPDLTVPELVRVVGLMTPPNPSTSPAAFRLTSSFASPATIPCEGFFAVGLGLPVSPGWSGDGLSTHASAGFQGTTNVQLSGSQQEEHAWQVVGTGAAAVVSHPSQGRTWRYQVLVGNGPIMQLGNEDAAATGLKFGMGGMFPDTLGGTQQWGMGISYAAGAGDTGFAVISIGQVAGGLPILVGSASLWLNPALLIVGGSSTLDVNGVAEVVILPALAATVTGKIFVQGVVLGASGIHLTNANHVTF